MKKLVGVSISKGIVVAPIHVLYDYKVQVIQTRMDSTLLDSEYNRFLEAIQSAKDDIDEIVLQHQELGQQNDLSENILEVHKMLLDDIEFHQKVQHTITRTFSNAETAVKKVIQGYIDLLLQSDEEYMNDRIHDFNEIGMRVIQKLSNDERIIKDVDEPCIIVANNLFPTQLLKMNRENIKGIILEEGGTTSHVSIIAKAYGIPMVIGVKDVMERVSITESPIVLLAGKGEVIIDASQEEQNKYKEAERLYQEENNRLYKQVEKTEKKTLGGDALQFHLNIDVVEELTDFSIAHSDGIGLFRSEFLLEQISKYHDSEEKQYNFYKNIVTRMGSTKPVTIRTFDAGGDKLPVAIHQINEENPLLGFRGVRYCLSDHEFFQSQLRAILRVSALGNVRLLIPMISCVDEMLKVLHHVKKAMYQLDTKGIAYDKNMKIGIMVEVPSIVYCMDDISGYCDFYSVGTNDLLQYIMATDRGNPFVSNLYHYFHPPFLRILHDIFSKAHQQKKDISLCGEMASHEETIPLLLGMGLRSFSIAPSQLAQVIVNATSYSISESKALLERALVCDTAKNVMEEMKQFNASHSRC